MTRSLALALAVALAIPPIPAFALRTKQAADPAAAAKIQGGLEEKPGVLGQLVVRLNPLASPVPAPAQPALTGLEENMAEVVQAWRDAVELPKTGQEPLNATLIFTETLARDPEILALALAALRQGRPIAVAAPPFHQARFARLAHAMASKASYVVTSNDATLSQSLDDMKMTERKEVASREDALARLGLSGPIPASVGAALTKTIEFLAAAAARAETSEDATAQLLALLTPWADQAEVPKLALVLLSSTTVQRHQQALSALGQFLTSPVAGKIRDRVFAPYLALLSKEAIPGLRTAPTLYESRAPFLVGREGKLANITFFITHSSERQIYQNNQPGQWVATIRLGPSLEDPGATGVEAPTLEERVEELAIILNAVQLSAAGLDRFNHDRDWPKAKAAAAALLRLAGTPTGLEEDRDRQLLKQLLGSPEYRQNLDAALLGGDNSSLSEADAVSRDGAVILLGYDDGVVRLWSAAPRYQLIATVRRSQNTPVTALAFLPTVTGRRWGAGYGGGRVEAYDEATKTLVRWSPTSSGASITRLVGAGEWTMVAGDKQGGVWEYWATPATGTETTPQPGLRLLGTLPGTLPIVSLNLTTAPGWVQAANGEGETVMFKLAHAGLEEGQTYRLMGTEGRAFLEALLERGETVDVKLMGSPMDAHNTNSVRLRLGPGPGDLVYGDGSGTRLDIANGDRVLVTATGDPDHQFDITWVATGGMADPDSAQILQDTRPATAEELLRTGLEETQTFALDSADGAELAAQLGAPPAGSKGIAWVPAEWAENVAQARQMVNVFMDPSLGRALPPAATSWQFFQWHFVSTREQFIRLSAKTPVIKLTTSPSARPGVTTIQFDDAPAVGTMTEAALTAAAKNPALRGTTIRWVSKSAQPVTFHGQEGYAFFV